MVSRTFIDGETIYRRGEAAASAFELREGRVRLSWPGEGGGELSTVLGAGQMFGIAELISGATRPATAAALGDAVVSELARDELARLLGEDPEFAQTLFRVAFERLRQGEEDSRTRGEIVVPPRGELFVLSELRLRPAARELSQQMDADGIRIVSLPFHVGRRAAGAKSGGGGGTTIDLALYDTRPYSLSRRHFAIETQNGGYVVRDCGSHHGTIVNGTPIGSKLNVSVAPLVRGENRIVAGRQMSPFRFTLNIETG